MIKNMTAKKINLLFFASVLCLVLIINGNIMAQSLGINVEEPHESSLMELHSTGKGFLPPRMDSDDRDDINNPAEGLMIFNTDTKCIEFYNGGGWVNTCTNLYSSGPCEGLSTTVTFIYKGQTVTYGVVGSSGNCWMDRNLGASQVATSSADADAYGDLFQWGRADEGHQDRDSDNYDDGQATTPTPNDGNAWDGDFIIGNTNWLNPSDDNLWQDVNGINNPCPSGYRLPTIAELNAERLSWTSNKAAGAFASPLKLPVAGRRQTDGQFSLGGFSGRYWSSTVGPVSPHHLYFQSSSASTNVANRAIGQSVRCIMD